MAQKIEYMNPDDLVIIGLDTDDRHEHPLFDERVFLPVDENLVKNIIVYGVQHPILVRQEAGKAYVIDGRQRTRAARRAAGQSDEEGSYRVKVPVIEKTADDKRVQGIMISTNELRQEDDVLAKAVKAQRLYDMLGDLDEVAIAFGRSTATIRNWLKLGEADPRVHAAVRSGKLSVSAAVEVAKTKREEQRELLETLVQAAGGTRVSESQAKAAVTGSDTTKAAAGAGTSTAATTKKKSGRSSNQSGIKRVWLRKALATETAKALTDDQRAVLNWFATGQAEKGAWFDDFRFDAELEMESNPTKAKSKKSAEPDGQEDSDIPPEPGEEAMTEDQIAAELAALAGGGEAAN